LERSLNGPERFLENSGCDVTGEVCGCDLVAPPPDRRHRRVKLRFNLDLALRGWIGQRHVTKSGSALRGREDDSRVRKLCRLMLRLDFHYPP
jgi:hypothetical protein